MIHSSTAEQRAVNSKVPGSNPGGSANGVVHTTLKGRRDKNGHQRMLHSGSALSFQVRGAGSIPVIRSKAL
jgi:hypothetical protein